MPCRSGTGRPRATGPTRSSTRWLTWGGRSPRRGVFSLRAGGFVLCGQDWDTFVIDSNDPELTRTIVRKRGEQVPSPQAARQYRNLLLDAGFRDATVEVHTGVFTDCSFLPVLTRLAEVCCEHGAIARAQADTWIAEQRERVHADRLFVAVPFFMAAATSP